MPISAKGWVVIVLLWLVIGGTIAGFIGGAK